MLIRLAALLVALLAISGATVLADEFLPPEEAFRFGARMVDGKTIEAKWSIANAYYMYHERYAFKVTQGEATLGAPDIPAGKIKFDPTLNKNVETHRGEVLIRIPVSGATGNFSLTATGQGCADQGLCYPPQDVVVAMVAGPTAVAPAQSANENERISSALRSGSIFTVAPLFFLLGLALSLTPCVLPMIPILSSIIVGENSQGRGRNFLLAFVYSMGMALVYTALGIAAGLAGEGLAGALQQPWVLASFAALLVALALSMFGFYELQIPAALQSRLAGASNRQSGGNLVGVFIMGAISALIVGPCVAAPLAGALVYISQTRNVVLGGSALFAMAAGMSVPLLLVGLSAGSLLPRVGAWMEDVKRFFGVMLIGVAVWMISPVIPAWMHMSLWACIAICSAVYLRALDSVPDNASGWRRLGKGLGVLLFIAGLLLLIGVASGGRDILQPLGNLGFNARNGQAEGVQHEANASARASTMAEAPWLKVASLAELEAVVAKSKGKPVMLDFYADWCVSCIEMERFTFTDPKIAEKMSRMVLVRADVTANTADQKALLKRFGLFGPPGIVFFDANGREMANAHVLGYQNAEQFSVSLAAPLATQ
jgi:thiol:disulfide interchange protein DsbD